MPDGPLDPAAHALRDRYNAHAIACNPDDFWGQVRRTLHGQPLAEEQIAMIVSAITSRLELEQNDLLLDICCGNGVLTDRIFDQCSGGVGVDLSDALIHVAQRHFQREPLRRYLVGDAVDFVVEAMDPQRFTKVLCYGALMHFSFDKAVRLLDEIRKRYDRVSRVLIGSLPDKSRMDAFFYDGTYAPGIENDPTSALGIWRSETEFRELAAAAGWNVTFERMPATFYAAHYRYDAVLTRR